MATYTSNQLYGQGTPTEALSNGVTYTFTLTNPLSGSSYFTFETVREGDGFYDSTSSTNAVGTFENLSGVQNLVSSSYIFSVVINPGGGSFDFTPTGDVAVSSSWLRAIGNTSLEIS